jgi:hypothetical protein
LGPRIQRSAGDLLGVHGNGSAGDRLGTGKSALRNCRHCTLNAAVYVSHIGDVRGLIDDGGVVDICDRGVIDGRIADVDTVHILPADVIGRHINFARTERKPSDISTEAATATDKYD